MSIERIMYARIPTHKELPDDMQNMLNELNSKGKRFIVEEYFYNGIDIYVVDKELYLFKTIECDSTGPYNLLDCILYKADDLKSIYKKIVSWRRRTVDIEDIRGVMDSIETSCGYNYKE